MYRLKASFASVPVLGLLLAGCATGPAYPLMTPIQVAQDFGYDERPLGDNRYEISYVTPPRQTIGYRYDASPTERESKDMAFDLSTLRAAQLAQQSGWQGFDILDRHSSSDTNFYGPDWGAWGPGWGGAGFGWGGWGGWHRHRFGWGWGGDWDEPPAQRIQAQVSLTIAFTNNIKPGEYRATDVIEQVNARYPGVLGPAQPPLPGPAAQPAAPTPAKPTA